MKVLVLLAFLLALGSNATAAMHEPAPTSNDFLREIWSRNEKRYGNSERARTQTLREIRKLEQVREARLLPDQSGILVRFKDGAFTGLVLGQPKNVRE